MFLKIFSLLLIFTFSYCADNSWLKDTDIKLNIGLYTPNFEGKIYNDVSSVNFNHELGFDEKAMATSISLDIKNNQKYIPNVKLSYFNLEESHSAVLTKHIQIADGDFNASVMSNINFQVASIILYKDIKIKGEMFSFLFLDVYSGDIEFDLGLDTKMLYWKYEVQDLSDLTKAPSWIHVNEFIPLAYFGVKYYIYDLSLFFDSSSLGFRDAKSLSYNVGLRYKIIKNLYVSGDYLYEYFDVKEKKDIINFYTKGYRVNFIYRF